MWYHTALIVCFLVINGNAQTLGGYCRTPLNEGAKCISVWECNTLLPLIRSQSRTDEETRFLHSSRCGFDSSNTPYVCCGTKSPHGRPGITPDIDTTFTPNPSIPYRENCGFQAADRIYNGEATAFDEFPWMAVLQYLKPNGQRKIACAGSLISSRYVLTAAHCVTGEVVRKVGKLINVRLGEYNTSSPGRDCTNTRGIEFCNQDEVNVGIDEVVVHDNYNGEENQLSDIALIRLASPVSFSDYIQPICLPTPNEASAPGKKLIVAGWGKTEKGKNSDVKLKLEVPVTSLSRCADAFSRLNVQIDSTHICAGGEAGRDSCTGDSGGPLMRTTSGEDPKWVIEGLVSFGYNWCGTAGYPGVYTRIAKYVPWIHKNVRP